MLLSALADAGAPRLARLDARPAAAAAAPRPPVPPALLDAARLATALANALRTGAFEMACATAEQAEGAAARLATLVTTLSAPPPSEAAEAPPGPCSALEEVFGNSADTPCPCPLTLADAGAGFCSAAPRPDHQHPLLASEAVAAASEAGRRAAAARALHATALSTLADLVTAWRSDRAAAADARVQALRAGDSDAYLRLATARGGAGALPRSTRGLLAATDACLRTLAERLGVALPLPHDPAAGEAAGVAVAAAAWDEIVAAGAPTDVAPPPGLTGGELRPHQTAGVRWLVSLQRRGLHGILADDMGLGKTVQTIAAILHGVETAAATLAPPPPPALIVAPASLLEAWRLEVERWAPTLTVAMYRGPKPDRDVVWGAVKPRRASGGARVRVSLVLTSFEYASSATDAARLADCEWGWLVVDEAHRLKGGATRKLYSALWSVGDCRTTRLLLTGTPLQNDSAELLSLLHFLFPSVFADVGEWEEWFSVVETSARGGGARRGASAAAAAAAAGAAATLSEEEKLLLTARLHQVLRPFILLGLLELLADPRVRAAAGIHNAHAEERFIATVPSLCRIATRVPTPRPRLPPHPLPADVRMSSKLDAFDRLMAKVVAGGHKALVFSTSAQALGALATLLDARGIQHEVLTGDTPNDERATSVARFNEDPGATAFLLTIRAGGVGLNLQAADTVVFFDADPNPAANAQAAARAHRLTTTHEVRVVHLVTAGSIEERLAAAAAAKARTAAAVVDGGGFDGGGTSAVARRELVLAVLREAAAARGGGGDRGARGASDADLNAALARSEDELAVLTAADAERDSRERAAAVALGGGGDGYSRLASSDDVAPLLAAVAAASEPPVTVDATAFGRGKRRACRGEEEEGGVVVAAAVAVPPPPPPPADPTPMLVEAAPAPQQQEAAVPSPAPPPQDEAAAVPSPPPPPPPPPRALGRMTFSNLVSLYTATFGQAPRANNTDSIRRALERGAPIVPRRAATERVASPPLPLPADPTPEPEVVAPEPPQEETAFPSPASPPQEEAAVVSLPAPPPALGGMTFSQLVSLYTTTFGQPPTSNNTTSIRRALERGTPIVPRVAPTERALSPPPPLPAATRAKRAAAPPPPPPMTRAKWAAPAETTVESVGGKRAASAGAKRARDAPAKRTRAENPATPPPAGVPITLGLEGSWWLTTRARGTAVTVTVGSVESWPAGGV